MVVGGLLLHHKARALSGAALYCTYKLIAVMRQLALALLGVVFEMSVVAQGTVNFSTRVTGLVDAPATHFTGERVGSDYWGQLFAAPPGGVLQLVGVPVEFRNDAGIGYITSGGAVAIPGVAGGSPAEVKLVAWSKSLGTDYLQAVGMGVGMIGESAVITVPFTGNPDGLPPTPAANLVGLQGFVIPQIPEPSVAAMGLLAFGVLLIRIPLRQTRRNCRIQVDPKIQI